MAAPPLAPDATPALPRSLCAPAAQLVVQRSGQLTWLRRAAGQLWTFAPAAAPGLGASWEASQREVAPGSWLGCGADGAPRLLAAPRPGASGAEDRRDEAALALRLAAEAGAAAEEAAEAAVALLEHPRSGARFVATARGLRALGRVHPLVAAALTFSTDLRRLYAVTAEGALYALAAVERPAAAATSDVEGDDLPAAPRLVLDGLDRFGPPAALAFGPAGLVLSTARAVVGINLRSRSVAPIVAALAAHPACAALDDPSGPAVTLDHRRTLYLASARAVIAFGGDGSPPRIVVSLGQGLS